MAGQSLLRCLLGLFALCTVAMGDLMKVPTATLSLEAIEGMKVTPSAVAPNGLPRNRIVGGFEATPGRYPYMAGLFQSSSQAHPVCGGTLIAPTVVLTAAHCAEANIRFVSVGCHNVADNCDFISVSTTIIHPNYNAQQTSNDYMILILSRASVNAPIPFIADTSYANSFPDGFDITVIGYGAIRTNGPVSNVLLEVELDMMAQSTCTSRYNSAGFAITSTMMCATRAGKDSCQGDSGGPLFVKCPNGNDLLAGIVSWGLDCADAFYPGVYSRVSAGFSWVQSTLSARGITLPTPPPVSTLCSGGSPVVSPVPAPVVAPSTGPVPTPYPVASGPPASWTCPSSYYNANDGCDCDYCGDLDPDCFDSAQAVYCSGQTSVFYQCDTNSLTCFIGRSGRSFPLKKEFKESP